MGAPSHRRPRPRRAPAAAAAGALLAFAGAPALPAAEFYEWVDEQGNTHYTQTPPPERARAAGDGGRGDVGLRAMAWYGEVDGRVHRLEFHRGSFELVDRNASLRRGTRVRIGGTWKRTDERLELRFEPLAAMTIDDPRAEFARALADRRFSGSIRRLDDGAVELAGFGPLNGTWYGDGSRTVHGRTAARLVGDWRRTSGRSTIIVPDEGSGRTRGDLELHEDGRFELEAIAYSSRGMADIEGFGQWRYVDPYLRLRYLEVRQENRALGHASLRRERWKLQHLGPDTMRLRNTRSGRIAVFSRR